jgi:hypothetical protein
MVCHFVSAWPTIARPTLGYTDAKRRVSGRLTIGDGIQKNISRDDNLYKEYWKLTSATEGARNVAHLNDWNFKSITVPSGSPSVSTDRLQCSCGRTPVVQLACRELRHTAKWLPSASPATNSRFIAPAPADSSSYKHSCVIRRSLGPPLPPTHTLSFFALWFLFATKFRTKSVQNKPSHCRPVFLNLCETAAR